MNILITETHNTSLFGMDVKNEHLNQIKKILPNAKIVIVSESEDMQKHAQDTEIIITDYPSAFDYSKLPSLKWLHVSFAGVDTLPKNLMESDVLITNSSGVHPIPIAEHVMLFLLMFSRQMHKLYTLQIEKNEWNNNVQSLQLDELSGKTIAIFGLGRIGQRVAYLCKAFDMHILGVVRNKNKKIKNVDELFTVSEISSHLKKADFVVNCLPLTTETNGMYDSEFFKQMKNSSYFINIGRGKSVVEKDLIDVLKNDGILGAGLDVFEVEPLPKSSPLWSMKNVIITPHVSGQTPYYMDRVIEIFCENLSAYLTQNPMPQLVDKKRGY